MEDFMNKKVWVLIINTSLPNVSKFKEDLKLSTYCFDDFEEAKKCLREKLKELSFNKNAMFDGNGNIIMLDNYMSEDMYDPEDLKDDSNFLSIKKMQELKENLFHIFEGKDIPLSIPNVKCNDDYMIGLNVKDNSIDIYGCCDGPINGCNPSIQTNMFDMSKEDDYYLYIDDMFGQDCSSELYVYLKQSILVETK